MSDQIQAIDASLPNDWQYKRLGELYATNSRNGLYKPSHFYGDGYPMIHMPQMFRGPVVDDTDAARVQVTHSELKRFALEEGDLLFARRSLTLEGAGQCSLVPTLKEATTFESSIIRVRLDRHQSLPSFVNIFLGSEIGFRSRLRLIRQVAVSGVSAEDVASIVVYLPRLSEQRKIARILTTVDNLIEKTEALIAKYQAIKQGMMHDLFTRGVDEHGHLRPPYEEAPELYKQSDLGWIPKEWEVCRVDEAGTVKLGRQRSPKHQSGRFTTPYLRVANVFDGWIDYTDILEMDFTPTERDTFSVLPGDIFLNEGQSLELVGRSALFLGEPNHFCFQNTLIRFRAFPSNSPAYCRGIFKYWLDVGRFMTVARQTTSVAHLGADRLAKMLFPLPKPEEQTRIASRLQSQERQNEGDEKFLANLSKIKAGLMQDLLTGKVRVTVDEAEEIALHA